MAKHVITVDSRYRADILGDTNHFSVALPSQPPVVGRKSVKLEYFSMPMAVYNVREPYNLIPTDLGDATIAEGHYTAVTLATAIDAALGAAIAHPIATTYTNGHILITSTDTTPFSLEWTRGGMYDMLGWNAEDVVATDAHLAPRTFDLVATRLIYIQIDQLGFANFAGPLGLSATFAVNTTLAGWGDMIAVGPMDMLTSASFEQDFSAGLRQFTITLYDDRGNLLQNNGAHVCIGVSFT